MDGSHFDNLARALAARRTRRGVLAGALAALVGIRATEAACPNKRCGRNPGVCGDGCVCCAFSNGNDRCMSASMCESGPGEVLCPTGLVYDQANRTCVTPCDPASCASLGAVCGSHADGCGGTLACGGCPGGQECTPGGCKTANGGGCAAGAECASGVCAGGFCCDTACDGVCQSCAAGTCLGTTGGACGGTGACAGTCQSGACVFPGAVIVCADPVCSGPTTATTSACDGAGTCASTTSNCGLYLCVDGECPTGCTSDAECAGDAYCDGAGVCRDDQPNGGPCTSPDQCQSGVCAGNVCCDTACDGLCQSCAGGTCQGTTGGTCAGTGVCASVCQDGACVSPGEEAVCEGTGPCAATCQEGACVYPGTDTACGEATCSTELVALISVCNGTGGCVTTTDPCGSFRCIDGACLTSCAGDEDCAESAFCDDGGICRRDLLTGEPCDGPNDCRSDFCVDGFCCNSACTGECEACNLPESVGSCTAVPSGTATGCTGTGICNGACDGTRRDVCTYPGSETECLSAACLGGQLASAAYCDGTGACATDDRQTHVCAPFACSTDMLSCRETCDQDAHCAPSYRCGASGLCGAFGDNGDPCDSATDCLSDSCVNNVCRGDTQPSAPCSIHDDCASGFCGGGFCCGYVCIKDECVTCEGDGNCHNVYSGPCGPDGPCQGTCSDFSTCIFPGEETVCVDPACEDGVATRAVCDGSGACESPVTDECAPYACDTAEGVCLETCSSHDDCDDDNYCDGGECLPSKVFGESCAEAWECYSGACVEATCACSAEGDGAPCAGDRVCCDGVCCAEGGECQNGVCTVTCLPLGADCTSTGQCCLDGEAICHADVHASDRTRWPSHVEWPGYALNPDSRTCCRPFGASCTTHEDCCTSQHEIGGGNEAEFPVLCSPDGICGGPGAACLTYAGNFDLACETSVCCESVNIVTGHARECCATDEVCDPYGFGGCNYDAPLGAPCTVDKDCSTGHCREGICCDPCGGQCGKPLPDMTPCWDWDRLDGANYCCGGACISVRTDINCGTCGHTCPAGLDYCEPNEYPFICACSDPGNPDGVCQNETGHCRSTVLGNVCVMDEVTESVPARTTCAAACETDADCADFYGLFIEYMFPNESPNPVREVCRPYFRPNNPFAEICTEKATCSTDPNYCFGRCVPIYEDGPPQI